MAADRIINIKVGVTSRWINPTSLEANIGWIQTGQVGVDPGDNGNRVNSVSGNVNLQRMHLDTAFTDNVRIQLTLDDRMTDISGGKVKARWALPGEGSNPPTKAEGPCMFTLRCGDTNPIDPLNVSYKRVSDNLLRILDNRGSKHADLPDPVDNVPYAFVPGMIVELPIGNYFIQLDPEVGKKGTGITPLDEEESC
jgi:hypothetical protein